MASYPELWLSELHTPVCLCVHVHDAFTGHANSTDHAVLLRCHVLWINMQTDVTVQIEEVVEEDICISDSYL